MTIKKGSIFKSDCCLDGHHNMCPHHVKSPNNRKEHHFISLSNVHYNSWSKCITAVSVTSRNKVGTFNCVEQLLDEDLEGCKRLSGSFVRCDCVCRIDKRFAVPEGTITNAAFQKVVGKITMFVKSSGVV